MVGPEVPHFDSWRFDKFPAGEPLANFALDRRVFLADPLDAAAHAVMLYALGASRVLTTLSGPVDVVVHGKAPPQAVRNRNPDARHVRSRDILPLFHQEVASFGDLVRALLRHGFAVRNPSDEGDPELDFFSLPLVDDQVAATLLRYLATSPFIRRFAANAAPSRGRNVDEYVAVPVQDTGRVGYYVWRTAAWRDVSAQRDDDLELKGSQLLAVAPALWTRSAGLLFHQHPDHASVEGLFVQAGVSARTGQVEGVAISRSWT